MRHLIRRLLGTDRPPSIPGAPRLSSPRFPRALYAIGDVHGRLDLLMGLEEKIVRHAGRVDEDVWVVLLGDLVDRGPHSAQAIEHVLKPHPSGFRRLCLSGNHEYAMLEGLCDPGAFARWCRYGGLETLSSYGINLSQPGAPPHWNTIKPALDAYIPQSHRDFLAGLPVLLQVPGYILVHAGLRPGIPLSEQTDDDLRWFSTPPEASDFGATVVHGHSIVPEVQLSPHTIALDTGAYSSGRLSAVCLRSGAEPIVLEQAG